MAKLLANCKGQSRERAKNIIRSIFQKENIIECTDKQLDHLKRPELISFINTNTCDKDSYLIKGDELGFCWDVNRETEIGNTLADSGDLLLKDFIKDYCGSTLLKFNEVNMKDGFEFDFNKRWRYRAINLEIEQNLGMIFPLKGCGWAYNTPDMLAYLKDIFVKKNIPLPKKQTSRELLNELARLYAYQPTVTPTMFTAYPREMIPYTTEPRNHEKFVLCGRQIASVEYCSIYYDDILKNSIEHANYGQSSTDVEDEIDAAFVSAFSKLKYGKGRYTYHFDFGTLVDLLDRAEIIKDSN